MFIWRVAIVLNIHVLCVLPGVFLTFGKKKWKFTFINWFKRASPFWKSLKGVIETNKLFQSFLVPKCPTSSWSRSIRLTHTVCVYRSAAHIITINQLNSSLSLIYLCILSAFINHTCFLLMKESRKFRVQQKLTWNLTSMSLHLFIIWNILTLPINN